MVSSSESANRAKVLPVHVRACCSDPGWDLTQAAVLLGSFGTGAAGGCSYPEPGSPCVGVQQGPSLCGGGFALLTICPPTFFSCSSITSPPPQNPFGPCALQFAVLATYGGADSIARSWGHPPHPPPPPALELGVAKNVPRGWWGHSFAASHPRRGWWILTGSPGLGAVWQAACMDAILPGEAQAPVAVATLVLVPPFLDTSSRGGEEQQRWGAWVLITPLFE